MSPVCKHIRLLFKYFAQGHEPFRLAVLPVCSVPVSMSHSSLHQPVVTSGPYVKLELQLEPFNLTYQTFAILMLRFDFFLQSLKLPLLLSFLFLLIKNMRLLLLLGLLTLLILQVLVLALLQQFLFHHRRTVTELLQFLFPFYLPVLRLFLLTL